MERPIYTMAQWAQDRTFKAEPGQEISAEVYEEMLNCMPPETLPRDKARQALQDFSIPVHAGFLMGEPHSASKNGPLYLAFGMNDYGKGKHYYYLGLSVKAPTLCGDYYYFDCMSSPPGGRYYEAAAFAGDQDAINTAANYEATLYKVTFDRNGDRARKVTLYDPWACFEEGDQ